MTREELILKAKTAKSEEELLALAKENGMELSEESVRAYFEQMHKTGELADDELDNVAGGWCYNHGKPVVTVEEHHDCFECKDCEAKGKDGGFRAVAPMQYAHFCHDLSPSLTRNVCDNCKYIIYERGLWLCNNPKNRQ